MICPNCGSTAILSSQQKIYGRIFNGARIWACTRFPACDSYVGCHPGTTMPLGPMADRRTRLARVEAHAAFDQLWKEDHMTRNAAYAWISKDLGYQVHVGQSNVEQCESIKAWALERMKELKA